MYPVGGNQLYCHTQVTEPFTHFLFISTKLENILTTLFDQVRPFASPQIDEEFCLDQLPEQTRHFGFGHAKAFVPTRWLEDGDHVQVGNVDLEVLHCPGHTPGHVVFFDKEDRLALVGDVLFAGSIGRTDFPRGNHADLINAIKTKLWPLGDDVQFVPGHGPMSTFGKERQTNPYVGD